MQGTPDTDSEAERDRLRALRRFEIMDTAPEPEFDRIAELAASLADASVALVLFVDAHRQWHKAAVGTECSEIARERSLGALTIETEGPTVIEDVEEMEWGRTTPLVEGASQAHFYAGVPLVTPDGYRIGAVAVLGPTHRVVDTDTLGQLQHLADIASEALVERQYALGGTEEVSQTVLDHLPGIFYVLGPKGRLKRWNARFERISGYDPGELAGLKATRLFDGQDRERVAEAITTVFEEGAATVEADFVSKSGDSVPILFSGVRTYVQGTPHLAGMGIDVSEQHRQAQELRKAKEEAEEASRIKSAMLQNLSHEIRTPLTSIIGFSRVLEEKLSGEEARIAGLVHDGGKRLKGTIDSVLQLSKLETGTEELSREHIDLTEVVTEVADLLRPQAEENQQEFVTAMPTAPVEGHWNRGALRRITENLLENALKFTPEGGRVTLRVRGTEAAAILEVEDTGIGISEEALPDIFEAFKQESEGLDREYEGSGLGLSNVRKLTDLLGGTVEVESEKGSGTRFIVRLPIDDSR